MQCECFIFVQTYNKCIAENVPVITPKLQKKQAFDIGLLFVFFFFNRKEVSQDFSRLKNLRFN